MMNFKKISIYSLRYPLMVFLVNIIFTGMANMTYEKSITDEVELSIFTQDGVSLTELVFEFVEKNNRVEIIKN